MGTGNGNGCCRVDWGRVIVCGPPCVVAHASVRSGSDSVVPRWYCQIYVEGPAHHCQTLTCAVANYIPKEGEWPISPLSWSLLPFLGAFWMAVVSSWRLLGGCCHMSTSAVRLCGLRMVFAVACVRRDVVVWRGCSFPALAVSDLLLLSVFFLHVSMAAALVVVLSGAFASFHRLQRCAGR